MNDVLNILSGFANSFDLKNWQELRGLLCDDIRIDYSAIGGYQGWMSANEFVAQRQDALQGLSTHHLLSNPEMQVSGSVAKCRISAVIYRRNDSGYSHSHVIYEFVLVYFYNCWRIQKVRQQILWNEESGLDYPAIRENAIDV